MATSPVEEMSPTMAAARSITPRRSLPSGRAVVGALLVTVAAVGSFVVATTGESIPDATYLIAARPIEAGELLSPADFDVVPIDLPDVIAATTANGAGDIDGATMLRDLRIGELVSSFDVSAAPPGGDNLILARHELTFPVSRSRASQSLVPGDRVTVLATLPTGNGPTTFVAVDAATVVDWSTGSDGIGASGIGVLTLALDEPATVMALAHMANTGDITVVRTTRAMGDVYPYSYPVASNGPDPVAPDLTFEER